MERGRLGSAPTTANGGCGACGNITPTSPPVAFFRSRPCLNQRSFVRRIYRTALACKPAVAHPSASSWWKFCLVFEVIIMIQSKVEILGGRTRRLDQRWLYSHGHVYMTVYRIVIELSQLPICISALTRPWVYLYLIHRVSFLWLGTSTHRNRGWRGPRDESAHHDSEKSIDQCVWFSRWVSRL